MPNNISICRACESGTLMEKSSNEDFVYKDVTFHIDDYMYSVCDTCGYEVVTSSQKRLNDKKVRSHHRAIDGLLSASDVKRIRKKFNLTQHEAADIFGGGENAFSKYENDDVIQSASMDRLLRVADLVPSVFPTLMSITLRQALKVKSKQQFPKLICNYGECDIADSRNLPESIFHAGKFTESKKKKTRKSVADNWLNVVNS